MSRSIRLAATVAMGVAAMLVAAAWLGVFNSLPRWLRPEAYAVWLGDRFVARSLDDRIVLVSADSVTEEVLGREWSPAWRADHARLIDRLSRGGAAVIALDVLLEEVGGAELAGSNAALADAMREARGRGTAVVLAVNEREGGKPRVLPGLSPEATLGAACLGTRLPHSARIVPLAIRRRADPLLPSLALAATMALQRQRLVELDAEQAALRLRDEADQPATLRFTEVERLRQAQHGCPIIGAGDTVANLLIEYNELAVLRDPGRRIPYERAVAPDDPDLSAVRGKIAVVGAAVADEVFHVVRGPLTEERRYGFELQTDAINTILRGVAIRPAGTGVQFAATLFMALVGAAIAALARGGRGLRWALLGAAALLWMGLAVYVYAADRITLIVLIQLAALVSAYGIVRRTKRWVFP